MRVALPNQTHPVSKSLLTSSKRTRSSLSSLQIFIFLTLPILLNQADLTDAKKAVYRRNSHSLRRLSRNYDWQVDEHGGLRPIINPKAERSVRAECANDSYILDTILKGYNRHKIPGGKVEVEVEVWVQEITTISDITSDFQLDIYISEMWLDPALDYAGLNPCKYNLSLNSILLEKLWTPNSCFINSKTAEIHNSPFPNVFLLIYANGSVWTNYRLKLQGPCLMDLTRFPFDNVTCSLTFESFNYNTDEVEMSWSSVGVAKMREKIELADYELTSISNQRNKETYPAGFWHELTMSFHFKRRAGWYILQAYLPTYLTICISWISFALGSKAIPARTMLGVNSLLAMTFQFGNIIRNLPRVSYVKAIDVWMLSCMTFVFCSLLELAWVGYLSRDEEPDRPPPPPMPATAKVTDKPPPSPLQVDSKYSTLHRRKVQSDEESALLSLKDNDYGYIPPGFGLNGNISSAMRSLSGRCSCEPRPSTEHDELLQSAFQFHLPRNGSIRGMEEPLLGPKLTKRQENDRLAVRIDKLSSFMFPFLFSLFNIAYWFHYLRDPKE